MTPDSDGTLDLVTVVYRREIAFLRLQAQSIARYLDPAGIGRIVVIVNDVREDECVVQVEALRPGYGPYAPRLEVLRPDALFSARTRGLRQRFLLWFTRHRSLYPIGVKRGWRGNRGWSVQQALKLAVARHGESRLVLLLDAKNHFVRPIGLSAFVDPGGRPLTYLAPPTGKFYGWIAGSFRLLGVPPPPREKPAPPTITPVCVPRSALLGCLDALEARVGPAEAFFARTRSEESKFMLIYAYVEKACGGWDAVFAPGLLPPATIFRSTSSPEIDQILTRVETGEAEVFSVHTMRLASITPGERRRIAAIWRERGLAAAEIFPEGGPP